VDELGDLPIGPFVKLVGSGLPEEIADVLSTLPVAMKRVRGQSLALLKLPPGFPAIQ
jgi:hypothetical protein